jgi:hypothetical protein
VRFGVGWCDGQISRGAFSPTQGSFAHRGRGCGELLNTKVTKDAEKALIVVRVQKLVVMFIGDELSPYHVRFCPRGIFFFFFVRHFSIDVVARRLLLVVARLRVREWCVRSYSLSNVAGGATLCISGGT